jgi:hypothetical protein
LNYRAEALERRKDDIMARTNHEIAFDAIASPYGAFFVRATYRDHEAYACIYPMRIAGTDSNGEEYFVYRVVSQRRDAHDMLNHVVYPTLDAAVEVARTETRIAVYHDPSELISF